MSSNVDICPSCKSVVPFPDEKPLRSLLTPFLGTNHVPSDSERLLGEEVVAQISADIANLEAQISRLQRFKNRLALYRKEHLSVLSKFRMLPVEVIASIFALLVNSLSQRKDLLAIFDRDSYFDQVPPLMNLPFTLASVCQQWRTIATSMPSLWTNVHLNAKGQHLMRCMAQTSWCLSRSGNHYLNVDVNLQDAGYSFEDAPLQWLYEVRISQYRWREARITFEYTGVKRLQALIPSSWILPELKFLSLGTPYDEVLSLPLYAPQLAEVELYHVFLDSFPWGQFPELRKLSVFTIKIFKVLEALIECDGLLHLRCDVIDHSFSSTERPRLVHDTLVSLETFGNGHPRATPLTAILERLELPALQDLTLATRSRGHDPEEYTISHMCVWDFISASHCMLKTFALERVLVSKVEWARYAPFLSTLTVLKLTENRSCIYNDILKSLAVVDNQDEVVLPQLERLEYNFHARSSRDSDYAMIFYLLYGVVKNRWEDNKDSSVVHRLESIEVRGARPDRRLESFEAFHALRAFRRKGFDLEMHFL